mgnify:CR=1 FL=1
MLIVRDIFTAKPGQASKLAKVFKKAFGNESNVRIMTDLVGSYNTVVMEMQFQSLDEFEKHMEDYRAGKMDPKVAEEMSNYTEMYMSGRREIFRVEE